jgi:hypothetical protein
MKLDPKNAEIVCDYGYYCYLRQDWKAAHQHFERALQLNPNLKRAHNNLGLVYARTHRPDDALRQFTMAGLNPGDARANLGFVYLTEKRFQQAKQELQLAATGTPRSEKARNILTRFDKIESAAQPEPVKTVAASAPAAPPSIRGQFDVGPVPESESAPLAEVETSRLPVEETRRLPIEETPRLPVEEKPRLADVEARRPSAEAPRPAAEPPLVQEETPRHVTVASKPAVEAPAERPAPVHNLPTQQLAPVLSDYQF